MYVTDHQKVRISLAQVIDRIFFETGNKRRCHKWVYDHYARYILGVSYDTYLIYLHRPSEETIPDRIVEVFEAAKARFDERTRGVRTAGGKAPVQEHAPENEAAVQELRSAADTSEEAPEKGPAYCQ